MGWAERMVLTTGSMGSADKRKLQPVCCKRERQYSAGVAG